MKTKVHARSEYIGHSSINGERAYEALCGMWVIHERFNDTEPPRPVTCKKCLHKLKKRQSQSGIAMWGTVINGPNKPSEVKTAKEVIAVFGTCRSHAADCDCMSCRPWTT